ncbi:restriction endonuclease subunit S [Mycoplasmoides gallisepticum]|uniref:restriction endonuclease subunit S n=1 Tax=Mycoplasmoides gallisepticum TaxID=2096 RepID=UPI0033058176
MNSNVNYFGVNKIKKSAKKPVIRFSGFTNEWERQSVKELCSITTGKSNTQDQDSNGKYPFYIRSEIVAKSNKFLYDCEAVITIGDGNIGRVFHYVNGKFDLHQRCYKMADFNTVTGKYFYYFFSTKFYDRAMRMTAKATVDSVRLDMIGDMEIAYPKEVTEQNKISLFLDKFEDLLALHQRKCQKLQNIKEAILEKMFPKNNADKPQIRFKGYTYAWERQSVKELCSITTGKSNTQDQDSNGKYPFYIRSEIVAKSNKFLYDCEAVITIGDGNIGRVFHYVNGKFDLHQRCYKMADFNTVTGKYFYYFFSTKFYDRAMRMTAKATVDSVRLDMIADMEIAYPKEVTEQNKISLFLDKFEDLLALHQRKCEKLQNIKEAILEKMFC